MPDDDNDNELHDAKARVLALADGQDLPVHVGIGQVADGCGLVIAASAAHLDQVRDLLAAADVTVPFELRTAVALKPRCPDPLPPIDVAPGGLTPTASDSGVPDAAPADPNAPDLHEPSTGPPEALDPALVARLKADAARRRRHPATDDDAGA